jgi:hypothetical protein
MKQLLVTLLFACTTSAFCDEVIQIPSPETGWFSSSAKTDVVFWGNENAKGTVLFLPGGEGTFNISIASQRETAYKIGVVGALIDIPSWNSAAVNSPYGLGMGNVGARHTTGHLDRVISAIQTIKEKTNNKPVWIHGHSNGSVSAFATYSRLQKLGQENLIAGVIVSGSRDIVEIPKEIKVPVLFVHHTNDMCMETSLHGAMRNFDTAKSRTSSRIEFVSISDNPTGGGCRSGSHMFYGSRPYLTKAINNFINQ